MSCISCFTNRFSPEPFVLQDTIIHFHGAVVQKPLLTRISEYIGRIFERICCFITSTPLIPFTAQPVSNLNPYDSHCWANTVLALISNTSLSTQFSHLSTVNQEFRLFGDYIEHSRAIERGGSYQEELSYGVAFRRWLAERFTGFRLDQNLPFRNGDGINLPLHREEDASEAFSYLIQRCREQNPLLFTAPVTETAINSQSHAQIGIHEETISFPITVQVAQNHQHTANLSTLLQGYLHQFHNGTETHIHFSQPPSHLIIDTQRVGYTTGERCALESPFELQLQGDAVQFRYALEGCICHEGLPSGGHFFCYVKRNNIWYEVNDQYVRSVSPSNPRFIYHSNRATTLIYTNQTN